jgi:hypothetical protein
VLDVFKAIASTPLELPASPPIPAELRGLLQRLFEKDPGARITLPEVMAHPWVTDGGQLAMSQAGPVGGGAFGAIEVTEAERQRAIDRASMVSMIRARLKEKAFRPGEYLIKQVGGDVGRGGGGGGGRAGLQRRAGLRVRAR